jgi:UDP-N-acetylmuramate--alanine ligase
MSKSYFFCGIGGSGMLPLAEIVAAQGHAVSGSDRSLDQGRLGAKFAALAARGIGLFAQDGSGLTSPDQIVVASAAVEATVPDIVTATALGCPRMTRAELLAELFNAAPVSIAIGGTSGKSTVTGMIGWILDQAGRDPTIMNGAEMKNYASGSRIGAGAVFVSEVDESDGSIALYRPTIAVLNNVAVDHKSLAELRTLFGGFLAASGALALNGDNEEAYALASGASGASGDALIFGMSDRASLRATDIVEHRDGVDFSVGDVRVTLAVPGKHNVANAMAAMAAAQLAGIAVADAATALASFKGLKRRMETVGIGNSIAVIDDFGHNPDKIAATLSALHAFAGRVLVFFQPHGFGPLKQMGRELADSFIANLNAEDRLIICDPVYFGGTTDKSVGADTLVAMISAGIGSGIGAGAEHIPAREDCGERLIALARPGDRIVVMGARDDTLSAFAQGLVERLS